MKYILSLLLVFCTSQSYAQYSGNYWCFGDSAGIMFNSSGNKSIFKSTIVGWNTYCSIAKNDTLLFYSTSGYKPFLPTSLYTGAIFNKNNTLMLNSDSLLVNRWYYENVIIPKAIDSNQYYFFQSTHDIQGICYSLIDMNLDNGFGKVVQKNINLYNKELSDLTAVKSGDGFNWWVLSHKISYSFPTAITDTFVLFKITESGIIGPIFKNAGTAIPASRANITFNSTGTQFILINLHGIIEEFDFNRCSGDITLKRTIKKLPSALKYQYFSSGAYSPNNRFFYFTSQGDVDTNPRPSIIYQIDLWSPNPWKTRDTIWYFDSLHHTGAFIRLAPDGKIYVAINANPDTTVFPFPYSDTTYNMYNMNLGVINKPNKKGAACDFQPFSFYLGGARTYSGLPNNPDYALGPLVGSPCDTLTGISNIEQGILNSELNTTYISQWQKLFVNAQNLKDKNCVLKIFDMNGREVFSSSKQTQPPYFTLDVDVSNFANGMYLVNLQTEKENLTTKFAKEN